MDEDMELRPNEALHDREPEEWMRSIVREEFWSLILYCFGTGNLHDDGIFDSNGSAWLIRGGEF